MPVYRPEALDVVPRSESRDRAARDGIMPAFVHAWMRLGSAASIPMNSTRSDGFMRVSIPEVTLSTSVFRYSCLVVDYLFCGKNREVVEM